MAAPKHTRAHRARSLRPPPPQQATAAAARTLLVERLPAERQRLLEASAIIDVCRYACVSKLEGFDAERLIDALRAAGALIDGAADALSEDSLRLVALPVQKA